MCDFVNDHQQYAPQANVPRPLFLDKPFGLHHLNELIDGVSSSDRPTH